VFAPSGYYVIVRPEIGLDGWVVRVLDFATWAHRRMVFPDETAARTEALKWLL